MAIKQRLDINNTDLLAILSDINNLPPAGTEDISAELEAQTSAVNALMSMVNRKVTENNGEGEYVWKKSSISYGPAMTTEDIFICGAKAEDSTVTVAYADSYTYDETTHQFTLVSPTEYSNDLDSSLITSKIKGKYVIQSMAARADKKTTGNVLIYIPSDATVGVTDSSQSNCFEDGNSGYCLKAEVVNVYRYGQILNFVSHVVAFDLTTYPDDDEQDNYWYELIKKDEMLSNIGFEGELACGTFTVSSDLTYLEDIVLYHNLNVVPKIGMIFKLNGTHSTASANYLDRVIVYPYIDSNESYSGSTAGSLFTRTGSAYGYSTKTNTTCVCGYSVDSIKFYLTAGTGVASSVTKYYSSDVTYGWIVLA